MSIDEIKLSIEDLKRKKAKDLEGFDLAEKMIRKIEDDMLEAKLADERYLSEAKNIDPELEQIYEDRRRICIDTLKKGDEQRAYFKELKEKTINDYDQQIGELESKLKEKTENVKNKRDEDK